jgi:type I restriction enzyme R subunit
VDRKQEGFEGLQAAQECIKTNELRDKFAKDFNVLNNLWEALSPDSSLNQYQADYRWLSQVYLSIKPPADTGGRLLWHALGAQTTELIHAHVHVDGISHEMEELILDADVIDNLEANKDPNEAEKVIKILIGRLGKHTNELKFMELSKRLEALRQRAEQGLMNSIEFVKELCKIARDTLQAERGIETVIERKSAKAALTELFLETKTDQTPAVVERIVNDIDNIVKYVRFEGWQNSTIGEREIKRELRKIIWVKYAIKDEELFNRAYEYIKEYY